MIDRLVAEPHSSTLQPYGGEQLERLENLGRSHVRYTFGDDRSGQRTYRFNALGYRGDDPDLEAQQRVFVFGESHAFGYFVEAEECWPSRFVDLWAERRALDRRKVCLANFADPGSSNASIARQLVTQCSAVRPDLVLVHFADLRRSEVILDRRSHRVGPWLVQEDSVSQAAAAPGGLARTLAELIERGHGFFRAFLGREDHWLDGDIDASCVLSNLRDLLLVQSFCRANDIRLIATCEPIDELLAPAVVEHPVLGPLARCLDAEMLCDFSIWSVKGDFSDQPGHAGPLRHQRFARKLFDYFYGDVRA